jgi:hypothetical protein
MNTRCLPRVFSSIQHGAGQIPERKHSTALVSSIAPECASTALGVSQSAGGNGIQSNSGQSAAPPNLLGARLTLWRARVEISARGQKGPRGSAPLPTGSRPYSRHLGGQPYNMKHFYRDV